MLADEAMLKALAAGITGPTLRLYGWEPACLSLGRNQMAPAGLEERAASLGIGIVRRPTGGQAVLHASEVTYAVVAATAGEGVLGDYRRLNERLAHALIAEGFPATLIRSDATGTTARASCFARPGRADLAVAGRKVGGSAQVRRGTVLLQHGSIKLWPAAWSLAQVLEPGTPEPDVLWPAGPPGDPETCRDRIARALATAFRLPWTPTARTDWENAWIHARTEGEYPVIAAGT
jgi:lipoate-protein ligase A